MWLIRQPTMLWRRRVLVLAAAMLFASARSSQAVPPIAYEGRAETNARTVIPENGEQTLQLSTSSTLGLRSYLWQPWFASLGATFSVSQVNTHAEQDSSVLITSGEGRIQVFPRSRFPFSAYAGVTDSRTEFESVFVEERDTRRTRFGLVQQYQPKAGNASYIARYERAIEEGTADDLSETSDRINLDANYSLTNHNLEASLSYENTRQDGDGIDFRDLLTTLRHSYRPSSEYSLESFGSVTDVVTETPDDELHTTTATVTSFGVWRPSDMPLTVTANARANVNSTSGSGSRVSSHNAGLTLNANYDVTRALRVSGTLSGNFSSGGGGARSSQSGTVSYNPDSFELWGYDYTWFTSVSASNSLGGEDSSRGVSGVIGHAMTRIVPIERFPGVTMSTSANQSVATSFDVSAGTLFNINHGVSAALARAVASGTTRLRLTVQDSRSFGGDSDNGSSDTFVQSYSLQGTHDMGLGRHSTLSGGFTVNLTRQGLGDRDSTFESSSIDLNYRHGRVFGINRLRFRSQLSLDSDTLYFIGDGEDDRRDVTWTNQFDYSIGRIDMRLKGSVTDRNGDLNTVIFFTLSRRFGGVF